MDCSMTELELESLRREHLRFDWTLIVLPGEAQILGSRKYKDGREAVATIRKTEEGDYGCVVWLSFFFSKPLQGESIRPGLDEALRSAISNALASPRKIGEEKPISEICDRLPRPVVQAVSESLVKGQIARSMIPAGFLMIHFKLQEGLDLPEICRSWNSRLFPLPAMFSLNEEQGIISCEFSGLLGG